MCVRAWGKSYNMSPPGTYASYRGERGSARAREREREGDKGGRRRDRETETGTETEIVRGRDGTVREMDCKICFV